jgi:two-component system phosphate regulon sensor histidine kinase PhoR
MKKRFRHIFFLAAFTSAGILVFQCYWVYNSYQTGERIFKNQLLNALQNSVSDYPLHLATLPSTLKSKSPYLAVVSSMKDAQNKTPIADERKLPPGSKFSVAFQSLSVAPDNLAMVQQMMARLAMQAAGTPVQMNVLTSLFNAELKKNNIELPCRLTLLKNKRQLPKNEIAAFIGFSTESDVVEVLPQGMGAYLFKANLLPAFISLLLILISGGSLWYMGLIILRQMKLDVLKNEFISNVTHELRTPIAILKSTHEALYTFGESANPDTTGRYLKINMDILDKLEGNVDRMLDITRYEEGSGIIHKKPVNLPELIKQTIGRFQLKPADDVIVVNKLANNEIETDPAMITDILTNLVDNAIKYSGDVVKVTISLASLASGWQLSVEDKGMGIAEKHLPFIFDKFYRIPFGDVHDVKGYGIGLSYTRQLVNALGGNIKVNSKVGSGTKFTIQFPAHG